MTTNGPEAEGHHGSASEPGVAHGHGRHHHEFPIKLTFLEEFKRRNLVRVAILYIVLCYIILEPFELFFHLLELPVWAGRGIVLLMVMGFPAVLLFSWIYEITPEGLKPTTEVVPEQSIRTQTGQKLNRAIIVVLSLALTYFVVDKFWPSTRVGSIESASVAPSEGATPGAKAAATANAAEVVEKSIAVLPFVDMSEKKDQEYFSDGLTEELIDHLAHAVDLKVIARTSCFAFKGKNEDMRAIAAKLGVANLLEGSVRKDGRSIRVTAQLIRAVDGTHLWSQSYDRSLTDIFKVQDEIADTVVRALKAALVPAQSSQGDAANIDAYNALLKGRFFLNKGTRDDNKRAQAAMQEALRLDPNYVRAWVDLAEAVNAAGLGGWVPPKVAYTGARKAINRALKLDPMSAAAHHRLGAIEWNYDFDFKTARSEMLRARELDPANVEYRIQDAAFDSLAFGRAEDALPNFHILVERNPLDLWSQVMLIIALQGAGRLAEAEKSVRASLQMEPDADGLRATLAGILLDQGRSDEALVQALAEKDEASRIGTLADIYWALGQKVRSEQSLQALKTKFPDSQALSIAESYARRGDKNAAFEWLDRAYQNREAALTLMRSIPDLRNLEGDPRYKAFLVKMNLVS